VAVIRVPCRPECVAVHATCSFRAYGGHYDPAGGSDTVAVERAERSVFRRMRKTV